MRSSVAAATGALALGPFGCELLAAQTTRGRGSNNLTLLILGGTGFIGPYVVRYAMRRGHTVTLFNRGRTNTHLFPDVERLIGDRDGQLDALKNRDWDAVLVRPRLCTGASGGIQVPHSRREFMRSSVAAATGALALGPFGCELLAAQTTRGRGSNNLTLLILGGTGFIGPYVVRYAMRRGHTVTLFNRGRTNTHLFPDVERLIGDRDGQLDALKNRDWDAVLDNTGYVPRHVRDSAQLLNGKVGRYLFTSTRQVFADFRAPDKKEDAPKATIDDPTSENRSQHYGALKVLCEQAVNDVYGDLATIVRPTAVAGPGDPSDRADHRDEDECNETACVGIIGSRVC